MYKFLFIAFLLSFASCNSNSERATPLEKKNAVVQQVIDSAAMRLIEKPLINSTSIGVFYNNQEYIGHYGELEKGMKNAPTNATIYEIGSLSKVLTGTLVSKAVLEGKLNLDDAVTKHLKEDYPNLFYNDQPIQLKHLVTHSGGMPNILPLSLNPFLTSQFLEAETPAKIDSILLLYSKEAFLEDLHALQIDTLPGANYAYSSAGTELTAHLLENVYDRPFEELLTEFLTKEVGMNETTMTLDSKDAQNLAVGYHADHPNITLPMRKLPWGAGGSVKSTVPDMLKFIEYQLEASEIVKESHKLVQEYSEEIGLGYFWQVHSSKEEIGTHYLHHGGVPRSQCFMYIVPKYELGIFIITNQSGKETAPKMREAVDEIIEGVAKDYNQEVMDSKLKP
ncbi:MAG: CubicO group peptidase (beta-lactamase class C family) [Flavobacteriales bacterium]|jgi:CubicO group peptidase (beta-lactamase class C family)